MRCGAEKKLRERYSVIAKLRRLKVKRRLFPDGVRRRPGLGKD